MRTFVNADITMEGAPDGAWLADFAYHGGGADVAAKAFPDAPMPWIDLSTGINPEAYPLGALDPATFARLPGAAALEELEAAAARRYGASGASVVAGAGTHALISALALAAPARRVGVLGPTYQAHTRAFAAFGADVTTVERPSDLAQFERAIVVNPNNPDGRTFARAELLELASRLRPAALLIVDEAFADFDGAQSLGADVEDGAVIVLRSFGKTYGLAGLRLSFALVPAALAPKLRAALGPWPIGGAAIAIGARALTDDSWLTGAGVRAHARAQRLDALLADAGWSVIGGMRLFRLARHPAAARAFLNLAARGILTRRFAERPDLLRFGLPAGPVEERRLAEALAAA